MCELWISPVTAALCQHVAVCAYLQVCWHVCQALNLVMLTWLHSTLAPLIWGCVSGDWTQSVNRISIMWVIWWALPSGHHLNPARLMLTPLFSYCFFIYIWLTRSVRFILSSFLAIKNRISALYDRMSVVICHICIFHIVVIYSCINTWHPTWPQSTLGNSYPHSYRVCYSHVIICSIIHPHNPLVFAPSASFSSFSSLSVFPMNTSHSLSHVPHQCWMALSCVQAS